MADLKRGDTMTIAQFRREVKTCWPHVKIKIRTVGFSDLARASAKCLTVSGDKRGDLSHINALAKQAGVLPDGNARCFPDEGTVETVPPCEVCGGILSHKDGCKFTGRRVEVE
jgi:hypothetical protein